MPSKIKELESILKKKNEEIALMKAAHNEEVKKLRGDLKTAEKLSKCSNLTWQRTLDEKKSTEQKLTLKVEELTKSYEDINRKYNRILGSTLSKWSKKVSDPGEAERMVEILQQKLEEQQLVVDEKQLAEDKLLSQISTLQETIRAMENKYQTLDNAFTTLRETSSCKALESLKESLDKSTGLNECFRQRTEDLTQQVEELSKELQDLKYSDRFNTPLRVCERQLEEAKQNIMKLEQRNEELKVQLDQKITNCTSQCQEEKRSKEKKIQINDTKLKNLTTILSKTRNKNKQLNEKVLTERPLRKKYELELSEMKIDLDTRVDRYEKIIMQMTEVRLNQSRDIEKLLRELDFLRGTRNNHSTELQTKERKIAILEDKLMTQNPMLEECQNKLAQAQRTEKQLRNEIAKQKVALEAAAQKEKYSSTHRELLEDYQKLHKKHTEILGQVEPLKFEFLKMKRDLTSCHKVIDSRVKFKSAFLDIMRMYVDSKDEELSRFLTWSEGHQNELENHKRDVESVRNSFEHKIIELKKQFELTKIKLQVELQKECADVIVEFAELKKENGELKNKLAHKEFQLARARRSAKTKQG
nr:paramyosin-like [Nothobranchius furzeri]